VFSISIAPKVFFHDALANHRDKLTCQHPGNNYCLHQQGFNCHFDDLVVTAPYLHQQNTSIDFTAHYSSVESASYYELQLQHHIQQNVTRGPPNS
jgi:hypothetical protein